MILSIFLFEIINVIVFDPIFLCIYMSAADAAAVNPNGIKGPLANDLSTFFINGDSIFNNGPRSLTRNSPNCTILDSCVFHDFILVDKLFAKAL